MEQSNSLDIETLLQDLQPGRPYAARRNAVKQLGTLGESNLQVEQALEVTKEQDPHLVTRRLAEVSLQAITRPITRREKFGQHPDLTESATSTMSCDDETAVKVSPPENAKQYRKK